MTDSAPNPDPGPAPQQPPAVGLDGLVDEVASCWKRAARSGRRALDGDYTLSDATKDWSDWVRSSTRYAVGVADGLWGPPPPASMYAGQWSTEMTLLPHVKRPVRLRAKGLRAIGENIRIGPTQIALDPETVPEGSSTFTVSIPMTYFQQAKTLLFMGDIVDAETGEKVTDTLIANNRDAGPVR